MEVAMRVQVMPGSLRRLIGKSVIVDVFRSSSTIVVALENGARAVVPSTSVQGALRFHLSFNST